MIPTNSKLTKSTGECYGRVAIQINSYGDSVRRFLSCTNPPTTAHSTQPAFHGTITACITLAKEYIQCHTEKYNNNHKFVTIVTTDTIPLLCSYVDVFDFTIKRYRVGWFTKHTIKASYRDRPIHNNIVFEQQYKSGFLWKQFVAHADKERLLFLWKYATDSAMIERLDALEGFITYHSIAAIRCQLLTLTTQDLYIRRRWWLDYYIDAFANREFLFF